MNKCRVLICIPCLLTGGTEIQTLNLVRALVQGGHKVTTLCYFEHSEQMVAAYEKAGSDVICLSKQGTRTGGLKGVRFLYSGLKDVIRSIRPDVAHVQYMAPGAIPILLLKLLGVKNVIATAHTTADIYPDLRLIHFIQRFCVRAFTCITLRAEDSFFGSAHLYDESTVLKFRNHFTIYNSLPSYIVPTECGRKFPDDKKLTIGVVSRLERIKGMDFVVPAFADIKKRNDGVRLLVVGDGSCRTQMEQQANDLNVADSIEFAGRQPQDALQAFYDRIDILLMPSRSEGFGLTAIEGMARGCVVVASDVGGLPEVVRDGEVGLLHRAEDAGDMAEKIRVLIDDRDKFRKRAGIEPVIGHLKSDHRMMRNYLRGTRGDAINTLMAAAAYNMRHWMNRNASSFLVSWLLTLAGRLEKVIFGENPGLGPATLILAGVKI